MWPIHSIVRRCGWLDLNPVEKVSGKGLSHDVYVFKIDVCAFLGLQVFLGHFESAFIHDTNDICYFISLIDTVQDSRMPRNEGYIAALDDHDAVNRLRPQRLRSPDINRIADAKPYRLGSP